MFAIDNALSELLKPSALVLIKYLIYNLPKEQIIAILQEQQFSVTLNLTLNLSGFFNQSVYDPINKTSIF